jgi:hypothetical protein
MVVRDVSWCAGVVTEVQALFSGTGLEVQWGDDLDVKGPESVHRFSERERLRKEEEALREVMQDGDFDGSHEDELFEGGEDHDGMPEADAVSTVRTPLLLHQRKALHWMLLREQPSKPIFWEPYVSKRDNQRGWFNTVSSSFPSARWRPQQNSEARARQHARRAGR